MSRVMCVTCGEDTSTDGTICPECSGTHKNAWRDKVNKLTADLAAANQRIAKQEDVLSALKDLDKSKSPCGHFASYAYSEDGKGKVIVCLLCEYLERAQQWNIDTAQDDLAKILFALGLGDHARPRSPHEVVITEVLPAIDKLRRGGEDSAGGEPLKREPIMTLEVGQTYVNGWGAKILIVSGPNETCRWFTDSAGNCWRNNGEIAGIGYNPRVNIVALAKDKQAPEVNP